jgi:hypothetical protein
LGNINDVYIRPYQKGDDEKIVNLLTKTFPKWNTFKNPMKIWKWKYIDTPQRSNIILAIIDEKIVGCLHSIFFVAKVGTEITSLRYGDDTAVDNDYRGQGISNSMRAFREQNFGTLSKYDYSTTVNPIIEKDWEKRHRSHLPFPVTRMVKINDVHLQLEMRPMKNKLITRYGYYCLRILNKITNLFTALIKHGDDFRLVEVSEFDEKVDSFWERVKEDYTFILEKKRNYLNWRFQDNERGKHIKVQAVKGDDLLGFMVFGLREEDGYAEGQIEDLIALKDRVDVADALLGYACKYFDEKGVNAVYYQVVQGHTYQDLSERRGFINSRLEVNLAIGYSEYFKNKKEFKLEHLTPSQVYFNYAETV